MAEEAPKTTPAVVEGEHQPAGLMTSARNLAGATQAAATQQTANMAKAAENALEAAKIKGKLDDKSGVGLYVDKAKDYLHQMHSGDAGKKETNKEKEETDKEEKEKEEKEKKEETGGGAAGGFMKKAQGFFK